MKYATVCSGIEAPSVAWEPLGWEPLFFSEIEPFANAVLAHRWPDVPNLGDMLKIHERKEFKGDTPPGREAGEEIANTLGGGDQARGWCDDLDRCGAMIPAVTGAVSAKWSKGSGGPAGDEAYNLVTHTLRGDSFDASEDGTGRGTPIIAFNVAPAIQASGAGTERTGNERTEAGLMIPAGDAVRRLTPRECERLQGFPDGYTLVPTRRGKMRAHEMNEMARYLVISALEAWAVGATPDGPRYRALGNSMAVPVVRWLGRRMESLT